MEDYLIYLNDAELWFLLSLWGIFSYFPSKKPTLVKVKQCDKMIFTHNGQERDQYSNVYEQRKLLRLQG